MPRKRPTTQEEWEAKRAEDRARYHANPKARYEASKRWKKKNREKINARRKERRREFRKENPIPPKKKQTPEETSAKRKAYYIQNREALCAKQRARNESKKHEVNARRRAERAMNPEAHNAEVRKWKRENPNKTSAYNASRRAKKRAQLHPDSDAKRMEAIYETARAISKSSGVPYAVDHIIPLDSGGWHHEDNLQPISDEMNNRPNKGDNPFWLAPHMGIKDWRDVPRHLWPIDLVPKYLALLEKHRGESIRWDSAA